MDTFWLMLLKPFATLVLFLGIVMPASWVLSKMIPNGRIKAVLFDTSLLERHRWKSTVGILLLMVLIFLYIGWLSGDFG